MSGVVMSQLSGSGSTQEVGPAPEDEVVDICRDLLRIDTSNYGDGSGPGEREAAELVAELLSEVGLEPELVESAPRRASVVARIPGADRSRPALLVHGHLDVVPARAEDWQVDPFAADVVDDCLWGRGAVDMKDMDAMILAVVRDLVRSGEPPAARPRRRLPRRRGGRRRARCRLPRARAAGPVRGRHARRSARSAGSRTQIAGRRAYLLQTAEKGLAWLRLVAHGPGRARLAGQRRQRGDPAVRGGGPDRRAPLAAADHAHRAGLPGRGRRDHRRPRSTRTTPTRCVAHPRHHGSLRRGHAPDTTNPTALDAGYKHNVIPGAAVRPGRLPLPARREDDD